MSLVASGAMGTWIRDQAPPWQCSSRVGFRYVAPPGRLGWAGRRREYEAGQPALDDPHRLPL